MITKRALIAWAKKNGLDDEWAVREDEIDFTVDYMDSLDESCRFNAMFSEGGWAYFTMRSSNYRIDPSIVEKFSNYFEQKVAELTIQKRMGHCVVQVCKGTRINGEALLILELMGVRCGSIAEFETNLYKFLEVWRDMCIEARKIPGIKFNNKDKPIKDPKMNSFSFRYYPNNNGGCYITTAVCQTLGKSDDCYELKTFREYRDNWLIKQPDGKDIIREYYNIAPKIVQTINELKDAPDIYREIWGSYLKKCLVMIEEHKLSDCKKLYMNMVNDLRLKYL